MIRRIVLGVFIAGIYSSASAEFVILDPTPIPAAKAPIARSEPVANTSARQNNTGMLAARSGSTLGDTLRKIVPSDWKGYLDKKLPVDTPVEYSPSVDWQQSLATLASRYNLVFKIDPSKKAIYVDQGLGGMRDLNNDNRNLVANTFGKEVVPTTVTKDGRLRFEIKDGQKLSEAIRFFLRAGKWDLAWEAGSDVVVSKGFVVEGGKLEDVLTSTLSKFSMNATLHKGNYIAVVRSNAAAQQ